MFCGCDDALLEAFYGRAGASTESREVAAEVGAGPPPRLSRTEGCGEKGVRSAQKMQVGPCIPVGIQHTVKG